MSILTPVLIATLLPYAIAILMPNWKWLLITSVFFAGLYTFLHLDFLKWSSDANGLVSALGYVILRLMLVSGVLGIIFSALRLHLIKKNYSSKKMGLISLSGLIPLTMYSIYFIL